MMQHLSFQSNSNNVDLMDSESVDIFKVEKQ